MAKPKTKKVSLLLDKQKALDELFTVGYVSHTFFIAGHEFTVKTIDIKDQLALEKSMQEIKSLPTSFVLFKYTLDTLAFTCTKFNRKDLSNLTFSDRIDFLEKQTPIILQQIVEKYEALSKAVKDLLADPEEVLENFSQEDGPQG